MHIISASKFRLGFSTTWNIVNSPLYFFNAFRLNLILNTYIFCILKFFRIRLVKWFLNVETRYVKLGIITFSSSKGNFSRIRKRKGKRKRRWSFFPVWNYTYIDQATRYTKKLYKYCSRAQHDRNTKWTLWLYDCAPQKRKVFPVVFYRLGKNRAKLKRKKTKWKLSLENIITSDRESDLIKKKHSYKSLKKFAQFPGLQMQSFLNFRIVFMLSKFSKSFFLNNNLVFKMKIFSFISYINLYIKRFSSTKKNKAVLRLLDWFRSKDFKFRKPGSRRLFVYPKNILFFDYFSYIKGLNDEFIATKSKFGRIKTVKPRNFQKLNMPWSTFFSSGLFMPYSYKRLIRKIFINMETKKTQFKETFQFKRDKILFIDYLVKFFVFDKLPASGHSSMKLTSFFFNRKNVIRRLKKIKLLLLPKIIYRYLYQSRHKSNTVKYYKKLKFFKNSFKLRYSKFLLSGRLHSVWNNINYYKRYITKPLTVRNFVRRVRRPFSKKFSSTKLFSNLYNKKIYKFFLIKYVKFVTKQALTEKIKQIFKKKLLFNPNLVSGSKNLKKYIEFFKVQKFFMSVYNKIFNKSLNVNKLKFNKIYFFILQSLIISVYNNLYAKLLIQLFIKLVRFNFIFLAYKKILSRINNTNLINLLSVFNFGKKHVNSFPTIFAQNKFLVSSHKKKPKKTKNLTILGSKRLLKNIYKFKKYFKLHKWYLLKKYIKLVRVLKKKQLMII